MPTLKFVLPARLRDGDPDREQAAIGEAVAQQLQALALINADWILSEWAAGRTPACCAKCNKTEYDPDLDLQNDAEFYCTPILFQRARGSCGSIAACHTGHKIAEAATGRWSDGKTRAPIGWSEAARLYTVQVVPGPDPSKKRLFHVVCMDNGVRLDPTIGMKRSVR